VTRTSTGSLGVIAGRHSFSAMSFVCEAVIFDLDGILADSNAMVERHLGIWAARHRIPFERVLEVHFGRRTVETVALLAPHLDPAEEAAFVERSEAEDPLGVLAFPGALRLIHAIPSGRWAVATSGTRRAATTRLAQIGIPLPDVLVTADDVDRGKPAPDPYLLAARGLAVDASRCVVIEDAPNGVTSAKAAGATAIGVASTLPAELLVHADLVVAALDDLEIERRHAELVVRKR
jgi:mannitol-1-/sugar-/sorbitol-6-phosphatase